MVEAARKLFKLGVHDQFSEEIRTVKRPLDESVARHFAKCQNQTSLGAFWTFAAPPFEAGPFPFF